MINWLKERYEVKNDGLYRKDGTRAGTLRSDGYRVITIMKPKKQVMLEHRAVWLMTHGYVPKELDHIDRNKSNNSITNLREATRSENNRNKVFDVELYKRTNKYRLTFQRKHIGYFETKEEALSKRKELEQKHLGVFAPI
jgi:hypothetical protein